MTVPRLGRKNLSRSLILLQTRVRRPGYRGLLTVGVPTDMSKGDFSPLGFRGRSAQHSHLGKPTVLSVPAAMRIAGKSLGLQYAAFWMKSTGTTEP